MRRDLCFMAALCLLVSLLAVSMATEGKTGPGPLAVAMATEGKTGPAPLAVAMATERKTGHGPLAVAMAAEENTGQGSLPPFQNNHRQGSQKLGSEYERRTAGSNSSVTAAGKGHIHVLSSSDQKKNVLKSSVSVSQDGKVLMSRDTSNEKKPSRIIASPYNPDEDQSTGRLLVAVARTLVTTTASTTTVTVLSTCHNNAVYPSTACTGRKRKHVSFSPANSEAGLDSSIASELVLSDKPVERAGRLILWSSSITTVVITTTSTTGAIIVTASFPCSFAGLALCG